MLLKNCYLIPELTEKHTGQNVYVQIEKDKIKAISTTPLIDDNEVIDCTGMTLLPGLIDMHTHLSFLNGVGMNDVHVPMRLLTTCAEHTSHYLDYGFTTIRDCGSSRQVANHVRTLVQTGIMDGPDILSCGLALMSSEIHEDAPLAAHIHFADGVEEFRKATRQELADHADYIKIFASGSAFNPSGVPQAPLMTDEEIKVVVDTAQSKGTYVAAHCHSDSSIHACINAGVKTIEHATYLSDTSLDLLLNTKDCYLVPTLAAMYVSQTDPDERAFWLNRLTPMLEFSSQAIEKAYRAGCKLGFGTDSTACSKQFEHGIEFMFRKDYCHMENVDILLQATKYSAEILGIDDTVGTVDVGKTANLILVNGNPLEDFSVMYRKPSVVLKNGRIVRDHRPHSHRF